MIWQETSGNLLFATWQKPISLIIFLILALPGTLFDTGGWNLT